MADIPVNSPAGNQTISLDQIQFDRSVTAGAVPAPDDLNEGALAINLVDGVIFTKDHQGNVIRLGKDYTADIASAKSQAISAARTYTDGVAGTIRGELSTAVDALKGGTLDATLDTLLKMGNRIKTAEADILKGAQSVTDLTKADVGLGNVENYGISDAIDLDSSEKYASSKAVKTTYDRAVAAETNSKAYADQIKSDLLGGAPAAALDTIAELALALQDNDSDIVAINTEIGKRATITYVNTELAKKVDIASISDDIDLADSTKVASAKAVKLGVEAAKAHANTGLALKIDKASISHAFDSASETTVASSKALSEGLAQATNHTNAMVLALAASMDYGRTF